MLELENAMILLASIGVLVLLGFIPQVVRSYKRKQMDDVSSLLMILIAVACFCGLFMEYIEKIQQLLELM